MTAVRTIRSRRRRRAASFICLMLAAAVAGCELLSAGGPAPTLFNLTPKSTFTAEVPQITAQLVIEEPIAAGGLDSNRIALRPSPTELKYFAEARWTERAPKMIQTLVVESFENTGKIVAVGRQVIGLRSDFNLKTELREFQAEYFVEKSRPIVRVRINAKLVKQPRQAIIASKSFETELQADGTGMSAIVRAFDAALGTVLKDLVVWTMHTMVTKAGKPRRRSSGLAPAAPPPG